MIQSKRSDNVTHRAGLLSGEGIPGLVSVIVPIFNRETFIGGMLESIKSQTYRPIEIVAVDDGSTDRSAAVVREWAALNRNRSLAVRILKQENFGAPAARNRGLSQAAGEFIQFFDSDDRMCRNKLAHQIDSLRGNSSAGFAFSKAMFADSSTFDSVLSRVETSNSINSPYSPIHNSEMPGSVVRGVFRREACRNVGYWNESLSRYQDWEYSLRYICCGYDTLSSDEVGFVVGLHDGPRIKDVSVDVDNMVHMIISAAVSALASIDPESENLGVAKLKIAQLYSFGLVSTLRSRRPDQAPILIKGVRDHTPVLDSTRFKNEAYFQLSYHFGVERTEVLRKVFSRVKQILSGRI